MHLVNGKNMDEHISRMMEDFCHDNTSGSTGLLRKAVSLAKILIESADDVTSGLLQLWKAIEDCHPGMEALSSFSSMLGKVASSGGPEVNMIKKVREWMDGFERKLDHEISGICENLEKFLKRKSTVLTLSRSETVISLIEELSAKGLVTRVVITESRPACEGVSVAKELMQKGIRTTLVVDAMADLMVAEADLAIIGADTVFSDRTVMNKIGSRSLALSCRDRKKPFYVVCGTGKLSERKISDFSQIERPVDEVISLGKENGPDVRNLYFELVEPSLITAIVTEDEVIETQ